MVLEIPELNIQSRWRPDVRRQDKNIMIKTTFRQDEAYAIWGNKELHQNL